MRKLLVFALVGTLGNTSAVFAGETLLTSATRIAQEAAQSQPAPADTPLTDGRRGTPLASHAQVWVAKVTPIPVRFQQGGANLQSSGFKKRTKLMIGLGIAAAFVASAYTIDQHSENSTPSTAGTRKDNGSKPPL